MRDLPNAALLGISMMRLAATLLPLSLMIAHPVAAHPPLPRSGDNFYAQRPATIDCVIHAAHRQAVPANVLLALASIEGGKNGQFVKNSNGSSDIGHFQINTIHFGKKGQFSQHPITQQDVAWRGCYNAELAAWMLRQHINEPTGQDFWTRAANYHSKTPKYNTVYRSKLIPYSIKWGIWLQQRYPQVSISHQ